jgi:hypothetical protein
MYCNEYVDFVQASATLDATAQIFEYVFRVKRPLPRPCMVFEHFANQDRFLPCGDFPPIPTTRWKPGLFVHRIRQFLPEGQYDWWVGMADGESQERLHVEAAYDDRIYLGRVRVGPLSVSAASEAVRSQRTVLPFLHRDQFPVYVSEEGKIVARTQRGDNANKAAVISVPKAGTYLTDRLLRECGFRNCGLHLSLGHFEDLRNATLVDADNVRYFLRAYNTTQLVSRGQSIVGHIMHCLASRVALDGFRKLFLYRNLRDTMVSWARYDIKMDCLRAQVAGGTTPLDLPTFCSHLDRIGATMHREVTNVIGWRDEPDVLAVRFEELLGDFGKTRQHKCVAAIASHVGFEMRKSRIAPVLARVIGHDTMTYSGRRSDWRECWNDEVEQKFVDLGLRDLNQQLGYENPRPRWRVGKPAAFVRQRLARLLRAA